MLQAPRNCRQGEERDTFPKGLGRGRGGLTLLATASGHGESPEHLLRPQTSACTMSTLPSPLHPAHPPSWGDLPPHPCPDSPAAPPPAAACGRWNPCRPGTQLTADRQWYFPSAWISGAGLIQRCFSISLTPHCPALITEMLMSCLAWKWFLHLGARTASL